MFPLIIAHRGWSGRYPENTLAAIRAAIRLRVDMVEIDVQQTGDGQLVVFHDHDLGRIYGKPTPVREARRAELPDAPTLAQVMDACRGNVRVLVEIKNADPVRVTRVIERCRMVCQVIVFSFDPARLRAVAKTNPRIVLFGLSERPKRFQDSRCGFQGWGLNVGHVTSSAVVEDFHRHNLQLFVWTVDRPADMRRLARWGVDGIITNHPDRARAIRSP